ncbi:MAG: response regulator transcription factor [Deltaproteobacteria bacterium]|nr:response regulator transcription factor [Deltaproteobacteria bacterium]
MGKDKISLLVVEDDAAILEGLLDLFAFHGYAPRGAADGDTGLQLSLAENFDLVILDVMLPGRDGFSVCRELRARKPWQPILMLTAKGGEEDVVTGFRGGADDYVRKPFSLRELLARVEALLRRGARFAAGWRQTLGDLELDGENLALRRGRQTVALTPREMDILSYLARNRKRTVSQRELLGEIWRYSDPGIETRTVDIHLANLRKKIAALFPDGGREGFFIRNIRGRGYRLVITEEERE